MLRQEKICRKSSLSSETLAVSLRKKVIQVWQLFFAKQKLKMSCESYSSENCNYRKFIAKTSDFSIYNRKAYAILIEYAGQKRSPDPDSEAGQPDHF